MSSSTAWLSSPQNLSRTRSCTPVPGCRCPSSLPTPESRWLSLMALRPFHDGPPRHRRRRPAAVYCSSSGSAAVGAWSPFRAAARWSGHRWMTLPSSQTPAAWTIFSSSGQRVPTSEVTNSVVRLAQRLDHAHEEFHDARRQIYRQTLSAATHRRGRTTLHLQLHRSDAAAARRWLEALDDADAVASGGRLLMPPFPPEITAFRRTYIAAITRQIDAAP